METLKYCLLAGVFALFFVACNNSENNPSSEKGESVEMHDESHEGHDHSPQEASSEKDKSGPEYTSKYICPMHCEGSGSEKPGKCPVCGMDYKANEKG